MLNFHKLAAPQAPLLCEGIRRVYGDTYPIVEFYDVDYVSEAIRNDRLHTVVALNNQNEVVAQMSTVLEQPGDVTADGSALMVDAAYRGQGATQALGVAMAPLPSRRCFLPPDYSDVLRDIYARLGADRTLQTATDQTPERTRTELHVDNKPGNGQARLRVDAIGRDFTACLTASMPANREVVYLDLPLSDPAINSAVTAAQAQGLFFGALMVDRCGGDRLRLQRYSAKLARPDAMVISTAEGCALRDFVAGDRARRAI